MQQINPSKAISGEASRRQFLSYLLHFPLCYNIPFSKDKPTTLKLGFHKKTIFAAKIFDIHHPAFLTPSSAENSFQELLETGITDLMLLESALKESHIAQAFQQTTLRKWIITPIFYGDQFSTNTQDHDSWAITEYGEPAWEKSPSGAWLKMICPNDGRRYLNSGGIKSYRKQRIQEICQQLLKFNPDGISLDFLRYFTYWEGVRPNNRKQMLIDTCFCTRCLGLFEESIHHKLPSELRNTRQKANWIKRHAHLAWIHFKTKTVTTFAYELKQAMHAIAPHSLINLHSVPWTKSEFNGAQSAILGQSLSSLAGALNWISPMTYTGLTQRQSAWINQVIDDVIRQTNPAQLKIIPALQIYHDQRSETESANELTQCLQQVDRSLAHGCAFWPWEKVSPSQKQIIKLYIHTQIRSN